MTNIELSEANTATLAWVARISLDALAYEHAIAMTKLNALWMLIGKAQQGRIKWFDPEQIRWERIDEPDGAVTFHLYAPIVNREPA